jgi:MGT family glycosyltransferase
MNVAVFAPDALGHFQPLRAVIAGLAAGGATVHVFTARAFAPQVEAAGGRFVDLFGPYPLEAADHESIPVPSRFVTYAAHYAEEVIRDVRPLGVSLVVTDTYAVIGRVVAHALGVPHVSVVAAHNLAPGPYIEDVKRTRHIETSGRCLRAVELLRERYGMPNASPLSYADGLSPHLNLLCEPEQWLTAEERRAFEPAAFFGSLAPLRDLEAPRPPAAFRGRSPKVYVSLGTVPWWYWPDLVADGFETVARAVGATGDVVISVGRLDVPQDRIAAMRSAGATVVEHLHTWAALGDADVFVTSSGANSTHEAVYSRVPMLSYPFHGDQIGLAQRCEELGLGIQLVDEPRAPLTTDAVRAGIAAITERREAFDEALERAHGWELAVIQSRPAVIERVLDLAQR